MYSIDEIKEDLIGQSTDIVNVTQMKSLKKGNEKTLLPHYLVSIKWEADLKEMQKKVRYCCNFQIKWEPYVKPKKFQTTQCYRCQRFGHVAKNCNMNPRCVKCSSNHDPGACTKMEEAQPVCVNCSKDHPANWRGCEAHKKHKEAKALIQEKMNRKSTSAVQANNTQSSTSYSAAARGWNAHTTYTKYNDWKNTLTYSAYKRRINHWKCGNLATAYSHWTTKFFKL